MDDTTREDMYRADRSTASDGAPAIDHWSTDRRGLLRGMLGMAVATVGTRLVRTQAPAAAYLHVAHADRPVVNPTSVVRWNSVTLQAIRATRPGPPMCARALAIVHTCIYDAWAAYDPIARATRPNGVPKVPAHRRHMGDKATAISYAAFRALTDLFPANTTLFTDVMAALGYDPTDATIDPATPSGIGNICARTVLSFRQGDGANQANDYADYTDYPAAYADYPAAPVPVNTPDAINDPNHWQPLHVPDGHGGLVVQRYSGPQWGLVTPFSLTSGAQFRPVVGPQTTPFGPGTASAPGYVAQARQILGYSAGLTDTQKAIAEYWKDGPNSELPPGHWCLFAQFVSQRDGHSLDDDVRLFFIMTNAVFDASVAAWDAKRFYNSVRPVTAVHYLYAGQQVRAWAGPGRGTRAIDGADWQPYQPATVITPPFPEFVSGHSAFSAAAAEILARFTRSDFFGASYTRRAGTSDVEPYSPAADVTLTWTTFSEAADQAGMSRRYGGIHFAQGDVAGRALGRLVAQRAWSVARDYITGTGSRISMQG